MARPYLRRGAHALVVKAREKVSLPDHITLAACRHGWLTELGDADLTEAGVMSLSAHKSAAAARLYLKRTQRQRIIGLHKRRAERERSAS